MNVNVEKMSKITLNLKRFEMPYIGVYLLFDDDDLIYIGQSINVFKRLHIQFKNHNFNNYSFIKCDDEFKALELEKDLIIKYKPRLNIQHKSEDINKSLRFHLEAIEKLNKQKDIYGII